MRSRMTRPEHHSIHDDTDPETPGERMRLARKLGERCLALYMAAHPDKSVTEAIEIMQRSNRYGRTPSAVTDGVGR